MKNCKRVEMLLALVVLVVVSAVCVPAQNAQTSEPRATNVRVAMRDIYGDLFVTIDGAEKKITDQAQQAWVINNGSHVVYSSRPPSASVTSSARFLLLVTTSLIVSTMKYWDMIRF